MICGCQTSGQIIFSLNVKKFVYVMQTFEDKTYQFVACKNRVLFAFNSDNQRIVVFFPFEKLWIGIIVLGLFVMYNCLNVSPIT